MSMKGLYLYDLRRLNAVQNSYDKIFFGHYGCTQAITEDDIQKTLDVSKKSKISFQYISPKVNEQEMSVEHRKVSMMLSCGQDVSINDWGLLYVLRNEKYTGRIFLGRLLSKSLLDWVWSSTILDKEQPSVQEYFSQNNIADVNKEDLLVKYNVSGIELNVEPRSGESYKQLKHRGFLLVGYTGYKIASCTRVCPLLYLNKLSYGENCKKYCRTIYNVVPETNGLFPKLRLDGNVFLAENNIEADKDLFSIVVEYG